MKTGVIKSKWQAVSDECLEHPQAGDYWEDHFCPVLIVLDVQGKQLTICDKIEDLGERKGRRFDLTQARQMTRAELVKKLSYGTIPGTWAQAHPQHCSHSVMLWNEMGKPVVVPPPPEKPKKVDPDALLMEEINTALTDWSAKNKIYLMAPQWRDLAKRIKAVVQTRTG